MARLVSDGISALIPVILLVFSVSAHAQERAPLSGVVVDQAGGAVPGARVTLIASSGAIAQTTTTAVSGAFVVRGLEPGMYTVLIEKTLFASRTETVSVPGTEALRVVLAPGGFVDTVVVTAQRVESRVEETPQRVEIVDAVDIDRTVAADVTDVLKKSAGVDVIQYNGGLSGIGLRGFRPQFSGINKRSLLLVDGRPSGVTNLATLLLDNVERIEVVKGAASAVYGSSAMGGVVNVITRESRGKVSGTAQVGGGSFGTTALGGRVGGNASSRVDFDVAGSALDQRDDIRMGNGVVRPSTSYKTYDGSGRVGLDLADAWRLEGRSDIYRGRDMNSPPDLASGIVGETRKNVERADGDARLTGRAGGHELLFVGYGASEASHTSNVTTGNPLDLPFLPYLSFESELTWAGAQARDSWNWSRDRVVFGLDYEKVTSVSRSFTRTGNRTAPFSADSNKATVGVYAENALRLRNDRTVVTVGGRIDHITTATLATPLKTNFTPSESTFAVFNPSAGVSHQIVGGLRAHATIGRAFIPAEAIMLTGFTTTVVGGRTQVSQGNPDLRPERSTSYDTGVGWSSRSTRLDATFFHTLVTDRFISNVVVSSPPPPAPIVLSVVNGLDAHISGLDVEAEQRLGAHVGLFANVTHYFTRKERLASGDEQDILNVALNTVRAGADLDVGALSARILGRYVQGRRDNDFNQPGFPIVDYANFAVIDVSATYRLARRHGVAVAINNLFDAFYYEKLGYPLAGRSFRLSYRLGF